MSMEKQIKELTRVIVQLTEQIKELVAICNKPLDTKKNIAIAEGACVLERLLTLEGFFVDE